MAKAAIVAKVAANFFIRIPVSHSAPCAGTAFTGNSEIGFLTMA